ncbi:MAG: cyanoexosortase B [Tychonema bourrellyi B0820]|uniref:Cyanoexosortase B n=1 Tax=Tychonema bourrellyi FEM_GT703 TaxID=2040638 RepID=A0A2G4EUU7_9CYAN|nr:cyanoexosortase B [Tychonema bourrellyi]MDQ2097706.1 cyanoexosortase B [Tychonema bourrellyi B0820]PHX53304.1 cyanoexosortase B [Tychonema bourrellyi FEM_GT703]
MHIQRQVRIVLKRYLLGESILTLLVLLYAPLLVHWYDGWFNKNISIEHEYFSHGLIGLPYAAYIAWTKLNSWRKLPNSLHPLGVVLLVLATLFYLSRLSDLVNLSLPLMLGSICLCLKGIHGLRLQRIPLLFVLLGSPNHIPYLIEPYALPLQHFIAQTSGLILIKAGLNVRVEEIYLYVNDQIVEVAPHCAGLKMLFTSLYVSLILLHWTGVGNSRWKSILFLASTFIISISSNILRNALLTYFHGTQKVWLFNWLHAGWGGDLYSACILGLLIIMVNGMEKYFPAQSGN